MGPDAEIYAVRAKDVRWAPGGALGGTTPAWESPGIGHGALFGVGSGGRCSCGPQAAQP